MAVAAIAALALMTAPSPAVAAGPATVDAKLRKALRNLVREPQGPPGVVAVVQRGKHRRLYSFGTSRVRSGRRIRGTDHLRIASVSKAFSGATSLSLVADGRLALDDTIGEVLEGFPASWAEITLAQLLHHTSGLPNFTADPDFLAYLGTHLRDHIEPLFAIGFVFDQDPTFTPGTRYEYSNTDNAVVGLMVEAVTGRSYGRVLRNRVSRPLGLNRTFLPFGVRLPKPFVHGYQRQPDGSVEDLSEALSPSSAWASGAVISTPFELNRFIRGYVGGRFFGPRVKKRQRSWRRGRSDPPGPGRNQAGLALFRYRNACGTVLGHTGNFPGYTAFAAATPNGKRSVTVQISIANSPPATGSQKTFRMLRKAESVGVCAALAR